MLFKDFALKVQGAAPFGGLILAFDPGETTGYCVMNEFEIHDVGQINTKPDLSIKDCYYNLRKVFADRPLSKVTEAAIEDYRVYDWKAESHSWSQVHTIKVVGLIQLLCGIYDIPFQMRMAQTAKSFCTDEKLEMWDLYDKTKGQRHARDALRHACYHAIWPRKVE